MLVLILLATVGGTIFFGEPERDSDYYRTQGEKLYDQEKYEESLSNYQKALDIVKDSDKVRAANLCNDISSVYYAVQKPDSSIEKCHQGLKILSQSTQRPDSIYFKLYSSLGIMYHATARADSSSYYFLLSDKLIEENIELADQIPEYVLHHYLNQGISVWRKHRYYDSINYFEKAMALSRRKKMASELSYIYGNLAEVYDLLHQHDKALKMRMESVSLIPKDRLQARQASYTGVGRTYRMLNNPDSSLLWFDRSLQTLSRFSSRNSRYHNEYIYLLIELSNLYLQKGEINNARERIRRATDHYRTNNIQNTLLLSNLYLIKGDIEKQLGKRDEAMSAYRIAFNTLIPEENRSEKEVAPEKIQHPLYAIRILKAKIEMFETSYAEMGSFSDLKQTSLLYDQLIGIKKNSYRQVSASDNDRYFYLANNQIIMDQAIHNGLEYYNKTGSKQAIENLFQRLEDANTTHLMDIISENFGENEKHFFNSTSDLSRIQERLDDKTVFISYRQIDSLMIALVVRKSSVNAKKWKIDSQEFESDLKELMLEVKQNPGLGSYGGSRIARKCYQVLLQPLEPWLNGTTRWVLARDWKFASLPFEVLEDQSGHFLADRYSIAYTYSASFFWDHPALEKKTPRTLDSFVFAPFVNNSNIDDFNGWKPISSMSEVRRLGQNYVSGQEATKQSFIELAPLHYILNLATHAFADLKNPGSSYVQFYPGVDSKLYLDEVMEMQLPETRLVMLSSCFGNEGVEFEGEGVISLAYAFARAGSPSLVTTSWEANENTTGFLTRLLSEYLEQGLPLDEALQKARQTLRTDRDYSKYNHPYFWANLSLLGNHSPVYESRDSLTEYKYGLIIVLAIAGLIFFRFRRKYLS